MKIVGNSGIAPATAASASVISEETVVEESIAEKTDTDTSDGPKIRSTVGPDDLKRIEGVGPKIAEILNAGGINSFAELANADTNYIKKILEEAGPRFKMADPSSWGEQAGLARDGKWEELNDLQDRLDGGKY